MTSGESDDEVSDMSTLAPPQTEVAALQSRLAALTEAVAARDSFLAIAAHELRNPMTPMLGQIQRLHRMVQTRKWSLDEIDAALVRITSLVELYVKRANVLLDVSRITTGKLRVTPEPFDAAELVRHVVAAHELAAQHAKCSLTVHTPASFDVMLDRLAFEQTLDNLLLNAIRYGAGKPVEIALDGDAAAVFLTVSDEGIGISDAAKARIFERFERAVGANAAGGFGVGLWVVSQLIDAMGGAIEVESVPGQGSRFKVTFPRTITQAP